MKIKDFYIHQFLTENQKVITGECLIVKPEWFNLDLSKIRLPKNAKVISIQKFNESKFTKIYDTIIALNLFNEILEYDKAVEKVFRLLKPKGYLLAALTSMTDANKNLWGFTVPSTHILFDKFFSKKLSSFKTYGNALAGRYLIEDREILTSYEKAKLNLSDVHFGIMVGFVGQKSDSFKKNKLKHID